MNLLQMSLSGAVMILVIVALRALAIHRLPKKAFLVLWGVASARLLIPYSFRSAFSIYSLLGRLTTTAETVRDDNPVVPFAPMAAAYKVMPMPETAVTDNGALFPVDPWVVVWAVGALACAVFFGMAYLKCRKEFRASLPVRNEYVKVWLSEHRIYRAIEIRQSGRISAPLTYGVFHPVILMPKTADWDDLNTTRYVLAHEYVHIRRFDALTKLILTATLCVHWFNPAVWIMYALANRDIELSCDEAVIREFGERTKSAYAMTLIRMEETQSGLNPLCNNFSRNAIEERIIAIMKIKKTSPAALIVAVALVVGVIIAFATSAKVDGNTSTENASAKADGSFDPMGPLMGPEKYPEAEFGMRTLVGDAGPEATTYTAQEISREMEETEPLLRACVPFGLSYETDTATGEISMTWRGKPVHSVYDAEKGVWIANSMRGLYLGPDAVDLEAVYKEGALTGLRETKHPAVIRAEATTAAGNGAAELVSEFVDLTPNGGAFTFLSEEEGNIATVKTVYDKDGRLTGVESQ